MRAMIMAGGKGTRLRPLTCDLPKPMVPVMNIPLMEHIILLLKKHDITEIGVTLMYLPQKIQDYFKDGSRWGVQLTYFLEEKPMGTAGSMLKASSFLQDTFLVISGDCMTDIDLSNAIEFHRLKQAVATLVLTRVDYPLDFGIVATDKNSYVTGFIEKPNRNEIFSDTINTGIYILEPAILNFIQPHHPFDFSRDLFPKLLTAGLPIVGYTTFHYWSDIGSLEAYLNTHMDILDMKLDVFSKKRTQTSHVMIGQSTVIEPTAVINGPCMIGENCYVGHGAVIDSYSVIGNNCIVEDQSSLKRSILLNNCTVGLGSELRGSILGSQVRLMQYVSSYENTAIGNESIIHERSIIKPNIRIWPKKTVDSLSVVDRNIVWASRYNPSLFRTGGLSGVINVDITPEFASRLGSAYGSVAGHGKSIVVSSDDCHISSLFKYAFISGLMSVGIQVYNLNDVSIPLSRQAVYMLQADGGVHVRRNSETEEKLDIGFFDPSGADVDSLLEKNIENVFYREDFLRCRAVSVMDVRHIPDFHQTYINHLQSRIQTNYIKENAPTVFIVSNCESILALIHSACRRFHIPIIGDMLVDRFEAEKIRHIEHFLHADITAFIDRHGEKLTLIDSEGNVMSDVHLFLLFAFLLFKTIPGYTVTAPLNMTTALETMAQKYGGSVKWTKASRQALLRGLMKAGVFTESLNQYMLQFDALASLAKLTEYLSIHRTSLDNLLKLIPSYYMEHSSILCPSEAIGKVMRILHDDSPSHRQLFNGIKINSRDGWVLIIPDAEKPFIHLYTEGDSRDKAILLLQEYTVKIKKLIPDF